MKTATASAIIGLLLELLPLASARAQVDQLNKEFPLAGIVLSSLTGEPIPGATVKVASLDRVAITDEAGRFHLGELLQGTYTITAAMFGYVTFVSELQVADHIEFTIELDPDPVLLEAIEVSVSRLEARRKTAPLSVQTYEARELRASRAFDAAEFLRRRSLRLTSLTRRGGILGLTRTARTLVYIDERPAAFGIVQLEFYRPDDFYLIEVYGGSEIHAYTPAFIERMARGEGLPLMPVNLPRPPGLLSMRRSPTFSSVLPGSFSTRWRR
jgi:hypothetical protein